MRKQLNKYRQLRDIRRFLGLRQVTVADRAGVTSDYVAKAERNLYDELNTSVIEVINTELHRQGYDLNNSSQGFEAARAYYDSRREINTALSDFSSVVKLSEKVSDVNSHKDFRVLISQQALNYHDADFIRVLTPCRTVLGYACAVGVSPRTVEDLEYGVSNHPFVLHDIMTNRFNIAPSDVARILNG